MDIVSITNLIQYFLHVFKDCELTDRNLSLARKLNCIVVEMLPMDCRRYADEHVSSLYELETPFTEAVQELDSELRKGDHIQTLIAFYIVMKVAKEYGKETKDLSQGQSLYTNRLHRRK